MTDLKAELQRLYADASKHAVYQNVPDFVSARLGYVEPIDEGWRGDRPRLAYLLAVRKPVPGETWLDFGANTGFFALSLAHQFPDAAFVAVEANAHHAEFIQRIARHFHMSNVEVVQRAVGLGELQSLPRVDFLLHLNVLHHAGSDFDGALVRTRGDFPKYAVDYLAALGEVAPAMLFQMGSNWGGDKGQPLVGTRDDVGKLEMFSTWLQRAGWRPDGIAYASRRDDGPVTYDNLEPTLLRGLAEGGPGAADARAWGWLDRFPGEFYRRPLFLCRRQGGDARAGTGCVAGT